MPDIPKFSSPLDYLGVSLLLLGVFLVLAGLKIIKVEKISVAPGQKTWMFGLFLCTVGIVFLFPQIVGFESVASLSPTTTPLPTGTPAVPTDALVVPIDTPTAVSIFPMPEPTTEHSVVELTDTPTVVVMPDQFIREYYEAINNRQYEQAWSMLSSSFKEEVNPTGFSYYVNWWDTVERVDIMETAILDQNPTTATVYTLLRYNMKDGRVEDSPNTFNLATDTDGNSWLIKGQN